MKKVSRIVLALGGNALLKRGEKLSVDNQRKNIKLACKNIAAFIKAKGKTAPEIILTHGNGPQVGLLALQAIAYKEVDPYPLDVLGAESEGMIGHLLEQQLREDLPHGMEVVTLLTHAVVSSKDPAFKKPTKFVGPVYKQEEAEKMKEKYKWEIKADGKKGWRRVVPSPMPDAILQMKAITTLLEKKIFVVCAGGGGIPVTVSDKKIEGVEAVVDKDLASCLLAKEIKAQALVMLTDVDGVYENYGKSDEKLLRQVTAKEMEKKTFAEGSMGPKVQAACSFLSSSGAEFAGIGHLRDLEGIINGTHGTIITKS